MSEPIDEEFGDWMEPIDVEPFEGDGAWGETWGPAQSVPAFWQFENRVVVGADGKNLTSSTQLTAGKRYRDVLNEGARVTLPGDPHKYRVLTVRTWPGDDSQIEVSLL